MRIVDADTLAKSLGLSRRTIISAAARAGGVEYLGNKAFVKSGCLKPAFGSVYDPSMAKTAIPVRGKHKTLQEVASMLGCSRSTVLRVVERTGLGITVGNRRYIPEYQIRYIKKNILARGVTTLHSDKKAMSDRGKRMAAARWS